MKPTLLSLAIASLILSMACSDQSPTQPTFTNASASQEGAVGSTRTVRQAAASRAVPPRKVSRESSRPMENGSWGSPQSSGLDNLLLTVTPTGATLRSECSSGVIEGTIQLDASGRFDVVGSYQIQAGPVGLPRAARFVGSVIGETMTITVFVPENNQVFGPFTLTFGRAPRIGYCPIV